MPEPMISISISEQRLRLTQDDRLVMDVAVSTANNGAGEINGSFRTPRGAHIIRVKIGAGCAPTRPWDEPQGNSPVPQPPCARAMDCSGRRGPRGLLQRRARTAAPECGPTACGEAGHGWPNGSLRSGEPPPGFFGSTGFSGLLGGATGA